MYSGSADSEEAPQLRRQPPLLVGAQRIVGVGAPGELLPRRFAACDRRRPERSAPRRRRTASKRPSAPPRRTRSRSAS